MNKYINYLGFSLILTLASSSVVANDFAKIPDFSPNTASLLISAVRGFSPQSGGEFDDLDLGESNGRLALVDNIESPECVAFLQVADNADDASQQLMADTINVNCN